MVFLSKRHQILLLWFFSTALIAFGIIGIAPINPQNINWLQIANPDSLTNYLGWVFYRFSPWSWPIGLNPNYGLEISSSIVFSDSIPLLAFLFKPINFILPETFQYFGIWYVLCIILQGFFAWKIISLISENNWIKFFSAGLFIFSPPMLWRIGIHAALVGHFLILAAYYLIFSSTLQNKKLAQLKWIALISIALLVQFYLFVMVFALWLGNHIDQLKSLRNNARKGQLWESFLFFICLFIGILLVAWQAGYFAYGDSPTKELGFGFYRTTLLSIFDPKNEYGNSRWSYIPITFPRSHEVYSALQWPLSHGIYEGFNYLGLGIILLLPLAVVGSILNSKLLFRKIKLHFFLFCMLIFLFLFSLSNNISIGSQNFYYAIPDWSLSLAGILRSSGRMFWPVFYMLIIATLFFIIHTFSTKKNVIILGICFFIQFFDTSAGWLTNHFKLSTLSKVQPESLFKNKFWQDAAKKYNAVQVQPLQNSQMQLRWEHVARYAAKYHMATNAVYLARINTNQVTKANEQFESELRSRQLKPTTLYILDDSQVLAATLYKKPNEDLLARIDNFIVLAPDWKSCSKCKNIANSGEINYLIPKVGINTPILFNSDNANLFLLLAGGHGWSKPNRTGIPYKDAAAKIVLPIPQDSFPKFITINVNSLNKILPIESILEIQINYAPKEFIQLKNSAANKFTLKLPDLAVKNGYVTITFKIANNDHKINPQEFSLISATFK